MKKGITPVIAMILLLLIVVSLAGGFMIWINSTWGILQNTASEDISTQIEQQQKKIRIENCDIVNDEIVIKNMGSADINATVIAGQGAKDLTTYYNGQVDLSPTITPTIIPPNSIAVVTTSIAVDIVSGDKIRVVAPANEDAIIC